MNKFKFDVLLDVFQSLDEMEHIVSHLLQINEDEQVGLFLSVIDFDELRNKVFKLVQDAGGE